MATFADIKTPYVNSITLKRVLASSTKENIFQGIMFKPNEAVTEKFSEDTDASEIQVLRIKPLANDAREIGASTNGAWFNGESAQTSSTEAYGIQILQAIDRNIDIPTNAQEMVSVDLAAGESKNLAGLVSRNINASTLAAMIAKNFNNLAGYDKKNSNASTTSITALTSNWVEHSSKYLDDIFDAGAKLDNGNPDEGIDAYPDEQRAVIIRADIKASLLKDMVGLYGGTASVAMANQGAIEPGSAPKVATTGYIGNLGNMPVYVLAGIGWNLAESFLGLPKGALDGIKGVVCSAYGTGRALAFNSVIKQIDAQGGQGIRIQPKYRWGVECWDALSVVPIVASDSVKNCVVDENTVLYLRGKGSRAEVKTPTESSYTSNTVKVATDTASADIYYTLDGTTPVAGTATKYTSAGVTISGTKTFKAVAVKNGQYSGVYSKSYTSA